MKYFFLIVFISFSAFSQKSNSQLSTISTTFFIGQHIEHDKKLKNAIDKNSYGFFLSYNETTNKNSKFNSLYNYPKRGFSFLYQNFNSTILGEVYAGFRHYVFHLNHSKKNQLNLATGFGLGYATKKYDEFTNPKNFAIGSHLLAGAFVKFQYATLFENHNIGISSSIGLIHFSNMSFKNPNLGINTLTFNLGVSKKLNEIQIKKPLIIENEISNKINYNLVLRGGYNESMEIDSGLYPFYTISFYADKKINLYSTLTTGIDFFNSTFLKEYIRIKNSQNSTNDKANDYLRTGIFIGHELTMNHFSLISQLGFSIYYPYNYESRIYERFGFKYKLGNHLFSTVSLKVNLFRAEALEFGIGYKF